VKILFLTAHLPYPPVDGWRIRTHHLLQTLASEHDVTLLSFRTSRDPADAVDALSRLCNRVDVVWRSPHYSARDLVSGLLGHLPFSVLNYRMPAMHAKLAEVVASTRPDIVHVEDIHMAQYVLALRGSPLVLDMHNIESALLTRYADRERDPLRKAYARLSAGKLKRYEQAVAPAFTRILTCSDVDARYVIDRLGYPHVAVVPNGVDPHRFAPRPGREEPNTLVFVGRMDYVANHDAMMFFCRAVLPRVWRSVPEARLYIIGHEPARAIQQLARDRRIVVTGSVPNVVEYFARAAAFVAPLRYGSGTRLKILEAMAMSKAIVATPLGCEGIEARPGVEIVVAEESDDQAQALVELLRDRERREAIGRRGRELVLRQYTWTKIGPVLLKLCRGLVEPRVGALGLP
jgi:sugar transferase (PEP-CTERM/EpsH1 system associated)